MRPENKLTIIVLASMFPRVRSIINGRVVSGGGKLPQSSYYEQSGKLPGIVTNKWQADELQYELVTRQGWGAQLDSCAYKRIDRLPNYVILMAVESQTGNMDVDSCDGDMRRLEFEVVDDYGAHDLPANAYVCEDGLIFEGSGWGYQSPLAGTLKDKAMVIGVIGKSNQKVLAPEQMIMLKTLLKRNVIWGRLDPDYQIVLERQVNPNTKMQIEGLNRLVEDMRRYNPGNFKDPFKG